MRNTNYFSFFNYIKVTFGAYTLTLFKSIIKFQKMIIKNRLRANFLRRCISHNIVPPHARVLHKFDNMFFSKRINNKFDLIRNKMSKQLLKLEIQDACCRTNYAINQTCNISYNIFQRVPVSVCNSFFSTQNKSLCFFYHNEQNRLNKKFNWLLNKKAQHVRSNIVTYFYNLPLPNSNSQYSLTDLSTSSSNKPNIEINISPPSNLQSQNPLDIKEKWFINLSSTSIPTHIRSILQLGDNFSLPFLNKEKLTIEFIKNVENNLCKLPREMIHTIRDRSTTIINRLSSWSIPNYEFTNNLKTLISQTKNFINNNDNLILTRADKGNVTVALDKDKYIQDMNNLLSDQNTYIIVKKDPLRKISSSLRELLTRWKNMDYISSATYRYLSCSDGVLPRAYGLPKIHKPNHPLRVIVSSINSPLYTLASFLDKIMHISFPRASSSVKNSFDLVNKLKYITIGKDHTLISLDAVSLFTNIPLDLAIESVNSRWEFISRNCEIPKSEFIIAVRLVLHSTFFTFNNIIYQQTYGTPMGSPLSPVIADIVMQDIENKALETLGSKLPFYFRYVDDIACAVPNNLIERTLEIFNSIHPRLQFTMEIGIDNKLNFLDVSLLLNHENLIFDWYHKPSFSGRYLNFYSQHPLCQKRDIVIGLIDRVLFLSHPRFHVKNFTFVMETLINNNYPIEFIFEILQERIKILIRRANYPNNLQKDRKNNEGTPLYFTVPYVSNLSERFRDITKDLNVKVSYFSLNKLNNLIKTHKDVLPHTSHSNVIYKINCNNCDASYVGQTGRQLNTRIKEHKNHIKRNNPTKSVITEHRINLQHDFDWDNITILDHEPIYHKRLISEMLYIKRQKNSLNLQTDTEGLHQSYFTAIDSLPKI